MLIRKNDTVVVIKGSDASPDHKTIAKVLEVYPKENKVLVEGINVVWKHVRPSRRNPRGGRVQKEMPISAANVMLYCPRCQRGVRVGRRYLADGTKERYCKKCKNSLGTIGPRAKRRQGVATSSPSSSS
ncbi:MAG: 50S ribosomal protein L24 [Gemmatales bacterium]|nr:50S ribosomal protein L24 [Gemmatales bacterium]MCS7159892.1 50S ribosomal protein L24 [Gemmatales bacterium]MDW8175091.1 50S ribosomal protein L24 [Gemmatales bacterium]MDW8223236.1 50S ribosomal protein L24 [Gemmatales bacterium]